MECWGRHTKSRAGLTLIGVIDGIKGALTSQVNDSFLIWILFEKKAKNCRFKKKNPGALGLNEELSGKIKSLLSTMHILRNVKWISIKLRASALKHVRKEKPLKLGFFCQWSREEHNRLDSGKRKELCDAYCAVATMAATLTYVTLSNP